jgi:uncharacterized membrane protein YeiH
MNLPSFPNVDLFSAGVNALNGALVAQNKSHEHGYAAVGIIIMAFMGGIGGGISRDLLLNDIPSPLKDQTYFVVCLVMGLLGMGIYKYMETKEEQFRTRALAYCKSFSLPWFAVLGAHKSIDHGLGILSAILVGIIATTAGGVFIDLFSGVTPEIVRPAEHLITTAILASGVYSLIAVVGKDYHSFFPITLVSVLTAFIFRVFAVKDHWKQIVPLPGGLPVPASKTARAERT